MTKAKENTFDTDLDENIQDAAVGAFVTQEHAAPVPATPFPKMFDAHDISNITGIHYVTVTKLFKAGKIKGKKFGRTWKATEQAVKDYLSETETA